MLAVAPACDDSKASKGGDKKASDSEPLKSVVGDLAADDESKAQAAATKLASKPDEGLPLLNAFYRESKSELGRARAMGAIAEVVKSSDSWSAEKKTKEYATIAETICSDQSVGGPVLPPIGKVYSQLTQHAEAPFKALDECDLRVKVAKSDCPDPTDKNSEVCLEWRRIMTSLSMKRPVELAVLLAMDAELGM